MRTLFTGYGLVLYFRGPLLQPLGIWPLIHVTPKPRAFEMREFVPNTTSTLCTADLISAAYHVEELKVILGLAFVSSTIAIYMFSIQIFILFYLFYSHIRSHISS